MSKIKYQKVGDYYYPDLKISDHEIKLSRFGRELLEYLEQYKYPLYFSMLCDGSLFDYLEEMDQEMKEQYDLLVKQYKEQRGITEALKEQAPMEWCREMNHIDYCVREVIRNHFIYN